MMKPAASSSSKQTVLQRLSNLLFGREEERRYGGVVSQEAQEGQNLVAEALRILQPNVSLNYRLNFIKEFCEYIRSYRIDSIAVFYAPLTDLLDETKNHPAETYEVGFQFMTALIEGQYAQLGPHRSVLFSMIYDSDVNALWKYRALTALTNHGRDISPFEQDLPNLLVKWLTRFAATAVAQNPRDPDSDSDTDSDSSDSQQYYLQPDGHDFVALSEILLFATNVMKYNQSHLEEGARHVIIIKISDTAANVELIVACLSFFDAVVRYGRIPIQTLDTLIAAICKAVNIEAVCEASCKTMNNLLSSSGHAGVMALCGLLGNPKNKHAVNILRGSVFFLGMANWGSQRIASLDVPPSAILASFLHALAWKQEIVAYEVILAVRRLVTKYGPDLSMEWDLVLLVLDKIHGIAAFHENNLFNMLKETVITIEELAAANEFKGGKAKLSTLSVAFVPFKKEADVLRTIAIMFEDIHPSSPQWPGNLQYAVEVFFVKDRRTKVRLTVLATVKQMYDTYYILCGEDLVERVLLHVLANVYKDSDQAIRNEGLSIVGSIAQGAQGDIFFKLVDIFDKSISTKLSQADETSMVALTGLLTVFTSKLGRTPPSHALGAWSVIMRHASNEESQIRKIILLFITCLRATNGYHLQYNQVVSPFLRTNRVTIPPSPLPPRATDVALFPVSNMVDVLLSRLSCEPMAELYGLVLDILCGLLRDSNMLADSTASVMKICDTLCKLLNERSLGACVQDYQRDDPRRDVQWILSYEIIGLICGYTSPQDELSLKLVMDTLVAGLFLRPPCGVEARIRIPKACLGVLAVCATLFPVKCYLKYLPGILSAISQMANAGKKNTYTAMEYLGVLVSVTQLTGSLLQADYESIFRCLLLFIDPAKHLSFVVAMAYRNLVLWFTTCDERYYLLITRSIETLVKDKDSNIGHVVLELLERYVYSDIDPVPSPTKSTSPVFSDARSKTWVQGNSFITVRTGRMGWAEIIMRRTTGCVCWIQQFSFKNPLFSDCINGENQRVASPDPLFPTSVSPTLINNVQGLKTMDRDPFVPISPSVSPATSPTQSRPRPMWGKLKRPGPNKAPSAAPRGISRSDSSSGSLELEFNLPRNRAGSPSFDAATQTIVTPRDVASPVPVAHESPPVSRESSDNDLIAAGSSLEMEPMYTLARQGRVQSQPLNIDAGSYAEPAQVSTVRMLARTYNTIPLPNVSCNLVETAIAKDDAREEDEPILARETVVKEIPTAEAQQEEQGYENQVISEEANEDVSIKIVESGESTSCHSPILASQALIKSKILTVDPPDPAHNALRLSLFYPPLPSYDEDELESPSFFATDGHTKMNLETQLLLHYGNSPTNNPPSALNTLGFLSPSKRPATEASHAHLGRLGVPDRDRALPDLGVSPRDGGRFFPPLSPGLGAKFVASQLPSQLASNVSNLDTSLDVSLDLSGGTEEDAMELPISDQKRDLVAAAPESKLELDTSKAVLTEEKPREKEEVNQEDKLEAQPEVKKATHRWSFAYAKDQEKSFENDDKLEETSADDKKGDQVITPNSSTSSLTTSSSLTPTPPSSLTPTLPSVFSTAPTHQHSPTPRPNAGSQESPPHSVPRLIFPFVDKQSPATSAESSPIQSPQQVRYTHNGTPVTQRRNVNFQSPAGNQGTSVSPTHSPTHPSIYRSASEPNIYIASPPQAAYIPSPLAMRSVNTSIEGAEWTDETPSSQTSTTSPFNATPKGITTRLRNNSVHFGTLPHKRSPRAAVVSPSPSSALTTPSQTPTTSPTMREATNLPNNTNSNTFSPPNSPKPKAEHKDVLDPGFVFFHLRQMSFEKAKSLRSGDTVDRAFNILDRTHIAETHKIGIVYVAPKQSSDTEILGNTTGSPRYFEFLRLIGKQMRLTTAAAADMNTGGLDRSGTTDGKHFVFWEDRVTQIVYHVTTLMPNLENEPLLNNKRRHIGNDFVSIVYSDCPEYKQQIILGDFNFVQITIYPLTPTHYRVEVMKRIELPLFGPITRTIIVDHNSLAVLVRTTAINANIQSILHDNKSEYTSNLEVRVKQIKSIKDRFAKDGNEY